MAVVEPVPFRVKLHTPAAPIVRGGSLSLQSRSDSGCKLHQRCGGENSYKTSGDRSEQQYKNNLKNSVGYYPLTANSGTPIGEWEIGVGEAAASAVAICLPHPNLLN